MKKKYLIGITVFLIIGLVLAPSINANFLSIKSIQNTNKKNSKTILDHSIINYTFNDEWTKTFGDPYANERGACIQPASDGGFIILGTKESKIWLLKIDDYGNKEWSKAYNFDVFGRWIEPTKDGGYIIVGDDFSYGSSDVALVKVDRNGYLEWKKHYGGPNDDLGMCVKQTKDDGYIITGRYYSDTCCNEIWLIKTDLYGEIEWDKKWGDQYDCWDDIGLSVQQTSDGGYILTGETTIGETNYDAIPLIKTDKYGNEEWFMKFDSFTADSGSSVIETYGGGYLLLTQWGVFDYGTTYWDLMLIKTDENGNKIWDQRYERRLDESPGKNIYPTADGGYIITGTTLTAYEKIFNPGHFDFKSDDIWLLKLDSDGNLEWDRIFGDRDKWESGSMVLETNDGGYLILGTKEEDGGGNADILLIKVYSPPDNKPDKPSGPTKAYTEQIYNYSVTASDPEGDEIFYYWDWGNAWASGWLGPYHSGKTCEIEHMWIQTPSWNGEGTWNVRVKFKDIYGHESDWSEPLVVNVKSKSRSHEKNIAHLIFERSFNNFPLLIKLINLKN